MPKSKVRAIEFVDQNDSVIGTVTDPLIIKLLLRYSEYIRLMRNSRAFENIRKRSPDGVLQIGIAIVNPSDKEKLENFVAFLNGENIYRYGASDKYRFRNSVYPLPHGSKNAEDVGYAIQNWLHFLRLPRNIIRNIFSMRITDMDEIETEVTKRREFLMRDYYYYERLKSTYDSYIRPEYLPPEVKNKSDYDLLGWLSNAGENNYDFYMRFEEEEDKSSNLSLDLEYYNKRYHDRFTEYFYPLETFDMTDEQFEKWLLIEGNLSRFKDYQIDYVNKLYGINRLRYRGGMRTKRRTQTKRRQQNRRTVHRRRI